MNAIVLMIAGCLTHSHRAEVPNFQLLYDSVLSVAEDTSLVLPAGEHDFDCVYVAGRLRIGPGTTLRTNVILVEHGGTLDIRTDEVPIHIQFKGDPLLPEDTNQHGNGLLVFGTLRVSGRPVIAWHQEPDLAPPGESWRNGDVLAFANLTLTMDRRTNLWMPQPSYGFFPVAPVRQPKYGVYPPVANLTRNIMFDSANPLLRGHTMFFDHADVVLEYAAFVGLGRTTAAKLNPVTNHTARYAVHFHHCHGPMKTEPDGQPQFVVRGCVADGVDYTSKWGFVVHQSHWGLIEDCVAVRHNAGFVTEDGVEVGTLFRGNLAMDNRKPDGYATNENVTMLERPGAAGLGFWLHSVVVGMQENVAVNNFRGVATAVTVTADVRDSTGKLITQKLNPLIPAIVPSAPGGMADYQLTWAHTNLEWFGNDLLANQDVGLDSWAAHRNTWTLDGIKSLYPQYGLDGRLPMLIEDSLIAGNGRRQVQMTFADNCVLFRNCRFEGFGQGYGISTVNVQYRRDVYLDGCSFAGLARGSDTGIATLVRNCTFNTPVSLVCDYQSSLRFRLGMTLENTSHAGIERLLVNAPLGYTLDSIPPCKYTFDELYGNVAAWRQQFGSN